MHRTFGRGRQLRDLLQAANLSPAQSARQTTDSTEIPHPTRWVPPGVIGEHSSLWRFLDGAELRPTETVVVTKDACSGLRIEARHQRRLSRRAASRARPLAADRA